MTRGPLTVEREVNHVAPFGGYRSTEGYVLNSGYYGREGAAIEAGFAAEWSIENAQPTSSDIAELWAAGDVIDRIVAEMEATVPYGDEAEQMSRMLYGRSRRDAAYPRCRLRASRDPDGVYRVSDYDWRRWSVRIDDPRFAD